MHLSPSLSARNPGQGQRTWQKSDDPNAYNLTPDQLLALHVASLVSASISISSLLIAYVLFFRMRRTFRHDLIMLLLQSDMLRALWFMIFPIVQLTNGITPSKSPFCQVSGFFLTLGTEACDVAVVLIAIHTALFVFWKGDGLSPYRRLSYALFITLPMLFSSLAFINTPAFANSGQVCYLPMHPEWTRLALSWIPRYIIFATLLATYAFIYVYVAILMKRYGDEMKFRRASKGTGTGTTMDGVGRRRSGSVPPLPQISTHGLISLESSRHPSAISRESRSRQNSFLSAVLPNPMSRRPSSNATMLKTSPEMRVPRVRWKVPAFGLDAANSSNTENPTMALNTRIQSWTAGWDDVTPVSPTSLHPREHSSMICASVPGSSRQINATSNEPTTPDSFWRRSIAGCLPQSKSSSLPTIFAMLRRGPRTTSSHTTSSVFLTPSALAATGMEDTRDNMRRQTRYLMIYPLIYLASWIFPFISHIMGRYETGAPFGVLLGSLLSICVQGTADAAVFSLREKPWRQVLPDDEMAPQLCCCSSNNCRHNIPNVGRTREEVMADNMTALHRLNQELAERRMERLALQGPVVNWWDSERVRVFGSVDSSEDNIHFPRSNMDRSRYSSLVFDIRSSTEHSYVRTDTNSI